MCMIYNDRDTEGARILIVDDVEMNRLILEDIVKNMGCETIVAEDGEQALELAAKNRPHLILSDISMPGMDGYELCKVLKANKRTKDIPIIFISAYDDPKDIVVGLKLGGEDYITKPFIAEVVQARVSVHLHLYAAKRELMEMNRRLQISVDAQLKQMELEKRLDQQDAVYKTREEKLKAIVEEVEKAHAKGQPVLVGTITIEASEELSRRLSKRGIQHKVLNAKFHELEAEIVADAGIHGAVTIATNMAGRGTDIKLDEEARAAGGLKIIGTERHESRRIDNQLRGRSGRQGDPGESKFYISLQDDLMRLFGSERLIGMFNAMGVPEGQEIEHKALTNAIESAQKKIENNNFGIRKNLLEYDRVMSEQREIIYDERLHVLNGESMRDFIYKMITDITENCVDISINDDAEVEEWNFNELNTLLIPTIPLQPVTAERVTRPRKNSLKQQLKEEAVKLYESKEAEFPNAEAIRELERVILLKVIDRKWMDHIDDMEQLRQGIGLQAYGQRDPLVEYKMSGYNMFDEMTQNIKEETVRLLFHIKVEQKVEREQVAKVTGTNKDDSVAKAPAKRSNAKIYPNDPCPCGSGRKYKQCCGRK